MNDTISVRIITHELRVIFKSVYEEFTNGLTSLYPGHCTKQFRCVFFFKDLLHRKSVRYTGLQNYEIVPLTNLP